MVSLLGIFFSNKFQTYFSDKGKYKLALSLVFAYGNIYALSSYSNYFLKKSFEKKYRNIDDQNLENIIKSMESYRLKAH
jgi:hypothetical protein